MNKRYRTASLYILLIIIAFSIISFLSGGEDKIETPDYMTFHSQVENGMVASLTIEGNQGSGEYTDGRKFEVYLPVEDEEMRTTMKDNIPILKYAQTPTAPWWTAVLSYVIPFALFLGIWFFLF